MLGLRWQRESLVVVADDSRTLPRLVPGVEAEIAAWGR